MKLKKEGSSRGQIEIGVLVLLPIFIFAMLIVVDFGKYIILRNQVKIHADSAALAAATATDIYKATASKTFVIDQPWGETRARDGVQYAIDQNPQDYWMEITIDSVNVSGNYVEVQVTGRCATSWAKYLGVGQWSATVTARARMAAGITSDVAP
jgi:Flp pilus assembly protein TadG